MEAGQKRTKEVPRDAVGFVSHLKNETRVKIESKMHHFFSNMLILIFNQTLVGSGINTLDIRFLFRFFLPRPFHRIFQNSFSKKII